MLRPEEAHTLLRLVLLTGLLLGLSSAARSETHESLLIYGVTVNRTPTQSWPGSGIYLGRGLVLTAAHVVGHAFWTRPKVIIAGQEFATTTIREGSFEGTDLTLLRVDQQKLPVWLALRLNPICKNDPVPGLEVATVARDQLAFSKVISPSILPPQTQRFRTVIGDVDATGNSGSGVFDIKRKCLLGIMSRKISTRVKGSNEMRDIAKYFVPASEIRAFIPAEYK
jgi:hypothetical protein